MNTVTESAGNVTDIPSANHNFTASVESFLDDEKVSEGSCKPHAFSKTLAKIVNEHGDRLGWNAAIILRYICYILKQYGEEFSGKRWVRVNLDHIKEQYPYLGRSTVDENLHRLVDFGCCQMSNFNQDAGRPRYDRTRWYHVPRKFIEMAEEEPRYFDKHLAAEIGVPAAVIYSHFIHLIALCKQKQVEERVRLKPVWLEEVLPFSRRTIKRTVAELVDGGFITPVPKMGCWYRLGREMQNGPKADEIGPKADKVGPNPDEVVPNPDNDSIRTIRNVLETCSKEKASPRFFEHSSCESNNTGEVSNLSQVSNTLNADGQGGEELCHDDAKYSPPDASHPSLLSLIQGYDDLHTLNILARDRVASFESHATSKQQFINTVTIICERVMTSLDDATMDKLHYDCDQDELVKELLPIHYAGIKETNIDEASPLFSTFFCASLECIVCAFLWLKEKRESYNHPLLLLTKLTYQLHLRVWKHFEDERKKAIEEDFAQRRIECASVDEPKEVDASLTAAEKTRVFRNGIHARNQVGWIFYDQQHRTDCIHVGRRGLKLIQKIFGMNPHLSAKDLLNITDRCVNLYINQPRPSSTIRHDEKWHARHGAQDVRKFALYLKAIVRDVGCGTPITFLGDADALESGEDEVVEEQAA